MLQRNVFSLLLFLASACTALGAKYAGESFALGAGARPLALGGAYVAVANDPSAIYYNPAGLAMVDGRQITLLHSETFGSLINHDFIAYANPIVIRKKNGSGAIGIYRVGGGGIIITEKDPNTGGPIVISEQGHYDYLVLLGAGLQLSEVWRLGGSAKIVVRSLADNSAWGLGIDAGLQYGRAQGFGAGITITNVTSTFLSYDNGARESIIPAAKTGLRYKTSVEKFTLMAVTDADVLFEGRDAAAQVSMGAVSIDTHFGAELGYHDLVYFRGGSDIGRLTLGVGLRLNRFELDAAFMDHSDLDNSYRISLNIAL